MKYLLHSIKSPADFHRVDPTVKALWENYLMNSNDMPFQDNILVWRFGPSNNMCRQYLHRIKGAESSVVASLYWNYQLTKFPLPKEGNKSILVDWIGRALAVVETTEIEVCSYDELGFYFESHGYTFGEIVSDFKKAIQEQGKGMHFRMEDSMPVVMESFQIVHQTANCESVSKKILAGAYRAPHANLRNFS